MFFAILPTFHLLALTVIQKSTFISFFTTVAISATTITIITTR